MYAEKNKYPFIFKRGKFIIAVNPTAEKQTAPLALEGTSVFTIGKASVSGGTIEMEPQTLEVIEIK